jgi:hypothetical protein
MKQNVSVAMADKMAVMRHIDAADAQWSTGRRSVRVLAQANPQVRSRDRPPGLFFEKRYKVPGFARDYTALRFYGQRGAPGRVKPQARNRIASICCGS